MGFSALYAAPAPPGQAGGAGNSSGVSGAASLQARVLALPQEHEVMRPLEHALHTLQSLDLDWSPIKRNNIPEITLLPGWTSTT